MNVLITGGAGFLGQKLARALLARGTLSGADGSQQAIDQLVLVDVVQANDFGDPRVRVVTGDITDPALMHSLIDAGATSVFHLAAVVSGQAEADFDLGMRINLDASRLLLEACRAAGHKPRVVFTSSVAVYGGKLPDVVRDDTALNPQSSYGAQKAIAELLLNDFSRKGFVDGRVLRLPTISVRPGKPNKAASSFASGIIREPLNGAEAICPVSPDAAAVAAVAAARDRRADRRARAVGRRARNQPHHQPAWPVGQRGRHGGGAGKGRRHRSRCSHTLRARPGGGTHRAELAGRLGRQPRTRAGAGRRRRFRERDPGPCRG